MNTIKNTIKKHFTIVPNALINDSQLPDRARFVFVLLASKPDDWEFYNKDLAKSLGYSIETLRNYMKKLEQSGWIIKSQRARKNGRFGTNEYILNSSPLQISPCQEKPDTGKNRLGETHIHTNTNYNQKEKENKKDSFFKEDTNSTIPNENTRSRRKPLQ